MKEEFLEFLRKLMGKDEKYTDELMTDNVKTYIEVLENKDMSEKPMLTDNGKTILKYLQETESKPLKSKDIADGMGISGKTVSGSMRKLVSEGFVEKLADKPAVYMITQKGKDYKID